MNNIENRIRHLKLNKEKIIQRCIRKYYRTGFIIFYTPSQIHRKFEREINNYISKLEQEEIELMILQV